MIQIIIALKVVDGTHINDTSALVKIMALRRWTDEIGN